MACVRKCSEFHPKPGQAVCSPVLWILSTRHEPNIFNLTRKTLPQKQSQAPEPKCACKLGSAWTTQAVAVRVGTSLRAKNLGVPRERPANINNILKLFASSLSFTCSSASPPLPAPCFVKQPHHQLKTARFKKLLAWGLQIFTYMKMRPFAKQHLLHMDVGSQLRCERSCKQMVFNPTAMMCMFAFMNAFLGPQLVTHMRRDLSRFFQLWWHV